MLSRKKFYDGLSADEKKVFDEAAKEAEKAEFAAWHDSVEKAKKQATEMGVEFINVDVNEFRNKVLPIHQELLNKTPALKPLYEAAEKANQQ